MHAHVPHSVPVGVGIALVGNEPVADRAQRIGLKEKSVAPVIERVEHEREVFVLLNHPIVAPELVGDHPIRPALPVAARHIEIPVVEKDPHLSLLRGDHALHGFLLEEVGDPRDRGVDRVVEPTVDDETLGETHGSDRGSPVAGAGDDLRRYGRWRAVDRGRAIPVGLCGLHWGSLDLVGHLPGFLLDGLGGDLRHSLVRRHDPDRQPDDDDAHRPSDVAGGRAQL